MPDKFVGEIYGYTRALYDPFILLRFMKMCQVPRRGTRGEKERKFPHLSHPSDLTLPQHYD